MAVFFDNQKVSYYLKKLINNSNDKLYLISPYLQLGNQLKLSLNDRHKFYIDIIIIYGKVTDINQRILHKDRCLNTETSVNRPILKKNWKKVRELINP